MLLVALWMNKPGQHAQALALSLSDTKLLVNQFGPLAPSHTSLRKIMLTSVT